MDPCFDTSRAMPRAEEILNQIARKLPNNKSREVFSRVTSSPLFWAIVQVSSLTICAAILSSTALGISTVVLHPAIGYGLIAIGCYIYEHRKQLLYEVSLIYTMAVNAFSQKHTWWSQITEHLVLGAIPLKNQGHLYAISRDAKVSAVLIMLERLENESGGIFTTPVRPAEWEAVGVRHLQIPAKDFKAVEMEHIVQGVAFIHEHIEKEETVYVHCKAGRGRSATVAVCYLLKHKKMGSVDEAIRFVKQKRPEISLNPKQRRAIDAYFATHCQ